MSRVPLDEITRLIWHKTLPLGYQEEHTPLLLVVKRSAE